MKTFLDKCAVELPPKGCELEIVSEIDSTDDIFDVRLTSNCIGAAVLIYELVETIDSLSVMAISESFGIEAQHPFGKGVGLVYLEHPALGKAVLRHGSREIRLTLLLSVSLEKRRHFESAIAAAIRTRPRRDFIGAESRQSKPA